jgi:hypothetical protein
LKGAIWKRSKTLLRKRPITTSRVRNIFSSSHFSLKKQTLAPVPQNNPNVPVMKKLDMSTLPPQETDAVKKELLAYFLR